MTGPFALYPTEQHWWSHADYGAVLAVVQRLKPRRVLEFGPGSSTLALLEGGAEYIVSCEDDPHWASVHRERMLPNFRDRLTIRQYVWAHPLRIAGLGFFDLALIDGPADTERRLEVVEFALARCAHVLVPVEEVPDAPPSPLREFCTTVALATGRPLEVMETGPLAGAFALIGPAP